ncbi:hypothetical protein LX32DRAFT_374540 [Colletotrichum zoysiae]|uniref:Uncharacterized protein n=1 Tax=Colletotrichum zoysiae TaxID=1216348 RepID=A0AAD9MA17_9PEZI|nr:hypothetical protein LX32DRAFT_374540 [Colletotrichum zoysiae]
MALNWAFKSLSSLANGPRPSLFCARSPITHHQVMCCGSGQSQTRTLDAALRKHHQAHEPSQPSPIPSILSSPPLAGIGSSLTLRDEQTKPLSDSCTVFADLSASASSELTDCIMH